MPEDKNNDTTLHVQGMRPLPAEQPFEAVEDSPIPAEPSVAARKQGSLQQKTSRSTAKRGRPPKASRGEGGTTATVATNTSKRDRSRTTTNKAGKNSAGSSTFDEIAELAQLDEENKQLRKSLAEKLRRENADLRKRLKLD